MSEFSDRLRDWRSRFKLSDQKTQLVLASVVAVIVLIAAVLALPGSDEGGPPGSLSQQAAEAAEDFGSDLGGQLDVEDEGSGGAGPGGSARSGATVGSPGGDGAVPGVDTPTKKLPPITATTIKVGIAYVTNPGAANEAAGFEGIGQVNQRRGWDAMIREVNKDPIFGRKVVPVYYSYSQEDAISKGSERIAQEACARWTQDNRVFMAWAAAAADETLPTCLTKAKVPQIGSGLGFSYDETFKKFPYLVEHNASAMDRMAAFEIDRLHAEGHFKRFKKNPAGYTPLVPADGKPKIGLIRYDQASFKAGAAKMKERLKAHGLSLCDGCEFEVAYSSDNVQEQLDDATEVNQAIQLFKAKGVTHVVFLGSTAGVRITLFYIDGAEKQNYRALLGFNTLDAPNAVRDFLGPNSYPQFQQSTLVTTRPGDFDTETPAFKKCKQLFEKAGETFSGAQASNKRGQIPFYCDTAWYFGSALTAAGRDLGLSTWMNGVHTMKPVDSAGTFLMRTTKERHDGAGAIRIGEWFDNCNCFKPTSGEIPV